MIGAVAAVVCALTYTVLIGYRARGHHGDSWHDLVLLVVTGLFGLAAVVLAVHDYFTGPDAAMAIKVLAGVVLFCGRKAATLTWCEPRTQHPDEEAAIRAARQHLGGPR